MQVFLQIVTGVANSVSSIGLVYLTAKLADDAAAGDAERFVQKIPVMFVLLAMQIVFRLLQDQLYTAYKAGIGFQKRMQIYESRVKGNGGSSKGEILNLYNEGIDQIKEYELQKIDVITQSITMVCAAALMLWISARLFLTAVILMPVCTYIARRINRRFREKAGVILWDKERINHDIKEILEGFYIIKAYLLEHVFLKHFREDCENLKVHEKELDRLNMLMRRVEVLLRYLPQLIIPLYGGWLCFRGQLLIGDLLAVNMMIGYVVLPVEAIIGFFKQKKTIQPVEEKLSVYEKPGEWKDASGGNASGGAALEAQHIFLSYDKNVIFDDFSFRVNVGEHLALMGESGCGKSTLLKILGGIFPQNTGEVTHSGVIAYVPQDPYIFQGSLKENICMGRELSKEWFSQLLDLVGLSEEVEQFPQGADTLIGEAGVRLSGGQIKRLAMARALAVDGDILLMDEPLSALNPQKVDEVQEKLSKFLRGKTVLVVTHTNMTHWENIKTVTLRKGEIVC